MQDSDLPLRFKIPWGASAGGSYITYPVPDASQIGINNGAASFTDGFPPNTFIPLASGGAGPKGTDFNGVIKQITAGLQWGQAGGAAKYNSAFSAAIGGYPKGATLQDSTDPHIYYVSTAENNTTNPESGGANWDRFQLGNAALLLADSAPGTRNFTMPAGNTKGIAFLSGGGGGGAGENASTGHTGGAGGAGGTVIFYISQAPGTVTSYTIGVGGANGDAIGTSASDGTTGGSSSFGSIASAGGGIRGESFADASGGEGGLGVVSLGSGVPFYGGHGSDGDDQVANQFAGNGGASFWGGGSRGSTTGDFSTAAFGAGGGGGYGGSAGSPGIDGVLVILGLGG